MSETQEVLRDVLILKSPGAADPRWVGELGSHGFAVRDCDCMPSFLRLYASRPAPRVVVAGRPGIVEDRVAQVRGAAPRAAIIALVSPSHGADRRRAMEAGADACHDAAMDTRELVLVLRRCGREGGYGPVLDVRDTAAATSPEPDPILGKTPYAGERAGVYGGFAANPEGGAATGAPASPSGGRGKWRLLDNGRRLRGPCGRSLALTVKEGQLVSDLMHSSDHLQPRSALARGCGRDGRPCSDRSVDVLVSRLRRKAKQFGMHLPVLSVRGCGYLFYGELEE
jgi:DNA-binding response OmpR family regulator